MSDVGAVDALFRFPVKSMGGEALDHADVREDRGVVGDRAFALVDVETGHVASAKHPGKWGALLACTARLERDVLAITLPDGSTLRGDRPELEARLSAVVGRTLRLADRPPRQASFEEVKRLDEPAAGVPLAVAAPVDTFFDFAPIHLVTTASLSHLAELAPASRFDVTRFRPNVVLRTDDAVGFVEDGWIGRVLAIGEALELLVVSSCPRCVMTTLAQGELPADPAILKTIAQHNVRLFELLGRKLPSVGVYATVLAGGEAKVGDRVRLLGHERLRRLGTLVRAAKRGLVR